MINERSRKRSGTSSPRGLPKLSPIYIDESLSQRYLPDALRARGLDVIIRADRFSAGVSDPEWLVEAGRQYWIVLTKDKAIRRRPNEQLALVNSGVRAFVLAAGEMTGPEQADLFSRIIPRIRYYVAELPPGPFVVRVAKDGSCEVLHPPQKTKTSRAGRRPSLR